MGLLNINFNFYNNNKYSLNELSNEEIEKAKKNVKLVIVDDEEVPNMENLKNDDYNIKILSDIDNIQDFVTKDYKVVILDIQGIGKKITKRSEGWGVLEYLKKEYPHIVIIVFTGADWSITKYKDKADLADFIIGKDSEYLNFKMKIDAAIRKSLSIEFHLKVLKKRLNDGENNKEEIESLIKKYGKNKEKVEKKLKKISSSEKTIQKVDNTLSIISSIYSITSL